MRWFFDVLYLVGLSILSPWLVWRAVRTGRYRRDLAAKLFGRVPESKAIQTPAIWFHGVSVGEVHLLVTLVAAFRKRHPDWKIVVSSTTDTGLNEARAKFAADTVIPFPFDFSWAVGNALDAIRPRLIVLAESELWPNFLSAAASRKIPVAVVNARMSPRSFARLQLVAGAARRFLFRYVSAFAVQSADYAERLRQLGVTPEKLTVTGSVKYDGVTATGSGEKLQQLLGIPAEKPFPILVVGSTHAPEEAILLEVFTRLRVRFPTLRMILVPRHPDRFEEVAELVQRSGLPSIRRSQVSEPLAEMPAVVLLDSMGELGAAWSLADLGYTGGSLDGKRGGQSMIEPAGYGVPTVFGPHVWNFRDAAHRLIAAGGAVMVKNAEELERELAALLTDADLRRKRGEASRQLVKEQQGATDRTLDVLDRLITSIDRCGRPG